MFKANADENALDIAILCLSYNHAKYIRKTLDGFLMQKTEYKFKAFVHDDASTDGTQDILREYEAKYPDLLTIIYEDENQYSKGIDIIGLMRPYLDRAKYVAWCEGDDYWIYPHKLQKQCEFMDSHPEAMLCLHNGINWDESADKQYCLVNELETGYLTYEESVCFTKGHFPTCSFFFKTNMLNFPSVSKNAPPVADDPIMYYSANNGQVYYMDKVWAIRTYMHPGSWNASVIQDSVKKLNYCTKFVDYLNDFYNICNQNMKPFIMDVIIFYLLTEGIGCFMKSKRYTFQELLKGNECLKETFKHKYDYLCDKCMIEMTKHCVDYPQVIKNVLYDVQDKKYIYGAGSEAAKLYRIVNKLGYSVEAFIVSVQAGGKEYLSHPVVSLDDIDVDNQDAVLLLGLGMKNGYQVIDLLREKEVKSRIIYNGHDILL